MTDEVVALVLAGHRPNAGHGEAEWFDRLDAHRAEVDAAVAELLQAGSPEAVAIVGAGLWPYWTRRAADGASWLERCVAATAMAMPCQELAELRYGAGLAAFRRGDNAVSRSRCGWSVPDILR